MKEVFKFYHRDIGSQTAHIKEFSPLDFALIANVLAAPVVKRAPWR